MSVDLHQPPIIMVEDFYFFYEGQTRITTASVGISRRRWVYVEEEEIKANKHEKLMRNNRFDQLPIVAKNGIVTEYFKTKTLNDFTKITREKIDYSDVIPIDTKIKDVIDKFALNSHTFYFLAYNNNIVGLITLGNLNCKQVQVYLFSLVCELERELSYFLNGFLTNNEIEDWVKRKAIKDNPENKYQLMLNMFNSLSKSAMENHLTEHFYLVDFFKIILDHKLYEKLFYSKSEWKSLSDINELRKKIAHPTRSLLVNNDDITKLKKRIDKINELLFRLITAGKKEYTNNI